jgi:hypothetical protein
MILAVWLVEKPEEKYLHKNKYEVKHSPKHGKKHKNNNAAIEL